MLHVGKRGKVLKLEPVCYAMHSSTATGFCFSSAKSHHVSHAAPAWSGFGFSPQPFLILCSAAECCFPAGPRGLAAVFKKHILSEYLNLSVESAGDLLLIYVR